MKTLIVIVIIFGLLAAGCRPTLNVTETNEEQIEENLIKFQKEEAIGAEIEVSLKDGEEINGELLSVRDSTITVCAKYSATEEELANLQYPIYTVRTDEIVEIKLEGNSIPFLIGTGIGLAAGTGLFLVLTEDANWKIGSGSDEDADKIVGACFAGTGVMLLGMGIGALFSTEEVILTEIPPGYKLIPLKTLARYPDEEPEYLRVIE